MWTIFVLLHSSPSLARSWIIFIVCLLSVQNYGNVYIHKERELCTLRVIIWWVSEYYIQYYCEGCFSFNIPQSLYFTFPHLPSVSSFYHSWHIIKMKFNFPLSQFNEPQSIEEWVKHSVYAFITLYLLHIFILRGISINFNQGK